VAAATPHAIRTRFLMSARTSRDRRVDSCP
jgi:hypothetical protein